MAASLVGTYRTSRKALDDLYDLVGPIALDPTELDQIVDSIHDGTSLGSSGHGDATTSLEVEETFITEDVKSTQHGVLVDPEHGSHVLGQREALSRPGFTVGDGPSNLCGHLVM
jgi:hypothetical protein